MCVCTSICTYTYVVCRFVFPLEYIHIYIRMHEYVYWERGIYKYYAEFCAVTEVLCMSYAEPYAVLCGASTGLRAKCVLFICFVFFSFLLLFVLFPSVFFFMLLYVSFFLFIFYFQYGFLFSNIFSLFFFPDIARIPTTSYAECYARPKAHKIFQNSCV